MDSRKLERILILILLLLNVFLLAVVLSDSAQARRSSTETVASVTALLEDSGIAVSDGAIRIRQAPPRCTLNRDMAAEQRIVARLIRTDQTIDQGGNIYFYSGARGQAMLRGSGEIDALFRSGDVPQQGRAETAARRLLEHCGIKAVAADNPPDAENVDFYCTQDGLPIYNAVLHFSYVEGSLNMLTGTRAFDAAVREADETLLDSVTVLIRFMEIVREEGYICSRLDGVTPGYLQTITRSGEAALTPVWHIETDAGALLIDAESGQTVDRLS